VPTPLSDSGAAEPPLAGQAGLTLLATFVAGMMDAVGFTQLGGLFVSFMSGNSTHLGMSIAKGDGAAVLAALAIVAAFVAGALGGTLLYEAAPPGRRLRLVLVADLALVLAALALAWLGWPSLGLAVVAFAMGLQNLVHRTIAGADIGRSFITGALFGLGQAVAHVIRGTGRTATALAYGGAWLAFVTGAVAGMLTVLRLGLVEALCAAAVLVAALLLLAIRVGR